jgi:hypothetical protein
VLLLLRVYLLLLQRPASWQMTRAELQDLLLVAVNLQLEALPQYILAQDSEHKTLLHASAAAGPCSDSSSSSSSSSSSPSQLVEQLITTAVVRGHTDLAP